MKHAIRGALAAALVLAVQAARADSFTNFETEHVRPLALAPDRGRLFAVNTQDNRLAIYDVTPTGLDLAAEVPVGLEPLAVAVRANAAGHLEAWVVNHLSDSISVVDVDPADVTQSHVIRTLLVGDEPRDVVFAGLGGTRAFITAAHRGQNLPGDPQLTTPGVGRADVWVFEADSLGAALGGTPLTIIQLFGDTPRALAASPDGGTVYAAVFHSGNRTTAISEKRVARTADTPNGLPPPPADSTPNAPSTGLIIKYNGSQWVDELNRDWSASVPLSLPDEDIFLIDANASPPVPAAGTNFVTDVGTVLFNMAVRPDNGKVYVTNTEARNQIRFAPMINGHNAESRITVIDGTTATPHHLNPHIDYSVPTGPQSEIDQSLAQPTDMAFSSDGTTVYVAGFGSDKIGVFDTNALEAGTIVEHLIPVGGGPSGVVLDEAHGRLYVMNRIDYSLSIVDIAAQAEIQRLPLRYDPAPAKIKAGRPFLYSARTTSGHGDNSCAICHVFADFDGIAWDLGDPFGKVLPNLNPRNNTPKVPRINYHPMKGPMTTQSLRGLAHAGPMHWRGDKTGTLNPDGTPNPNGGYLDEDAAFKQFNVAFTNLQGRANQVTAAEMQAFSDFMLTVQYPPNPIRALDNSDSPAEAAGRALFNNSNIFAAVGGGTALGQTCQSCHANFVTIGQTANAGLVPNPQEFKIPHLRNAYQKIGMFGVGLDSIPTTATGTSPLPAQFAGDQVRGFGFNHDGSVSTVFDWLHNGTFNGGFPSDAATADTERRQLEALILGADTGLRPIVGQQVTLAQATFTDVALNARLDLLMARADAGDCDLTVKGIVAGEARGMLYRGSGTFITDRSADGTLAKGMFLGFANVAGQELTFTCVPPGNGTRIAIDRDLDGARDRDELDAGSDPANPASFPPGTVCAGDCESHGGVTTNELITMTSIALGDTSVSACTRGDTDSSGAVTIDEIIAAVNTALNGCGVQVPTPTPTPVPTPTTHTVVVGPNGTLTFSPPNVSIHVGETVEWTWSSSGHNVVSGGDCVADDQFCSPNDGNCAQAALSQKGTTYSHTFTAAGTFPYHCSRHCGFAMVGSVTVQQ